MSPRSEFRTRRKIEFSDTDLAGIVHFSRFFVFMETAEHEFLRSLGTSVHCEHEGMQIGWPRLSASCEYRRPVRFEDELEIVLRVKKKGRRSMTYQTHFFLDGECVANGELSSVCCEMTAAGPRAIPIPPFLADQIADAE